MLAFVMAMAFERGRSLPYDFCSVVANSAVNMLNDFGSAPYSGGEFIPGMFRNKKKEKRKKKKK